MTPSGTHNAKSYFQEKYTEISSYKLATRRPYYLKDHSDESSRRCRFCLKGEPEVGFTHRAHVVPELLGNKSLLSLNECDRCNQFFADNYENHLGNWSKFARAVSGVPGKRGTPTYKNDKLRIESDATGLQITIHDPSILPPSGEVKFPMEFKLPGDAQSAPYIPLNAALALIKIACAVCPQSELDQCGNAISWLMGRITCDVSKLNVGYAFTPGVKPYGVGHVTLLKRKVEEPIPYLLCIVQFGNHRFQSFVPLCPADGWMVTGQPNGLGPHYPVPFPDDWGPGPTEYKFLDWSGTAPVRTSDEVSFMLTSGKVVDPSQK